MTDIKCPFCGKKLEPIGTSGQFQCGTWGCDASFNFIATRDVWEYIDRTRKELEQSETCCSDWEKQALDYKAENVALSGKLERTRKALDVAVDALKDIRCVYTGDQTTKPSTMFGRAAGALNKITALEQKDVK